MAKRKLRIFIASSSKYTRKKNGRIDVASSNDFILKPLIQAINNEGYEAVPWWKYFQDENCEDWTLNALVKASRVFDYGIFIVDGAIASKKKNSVFPNQNVILELGMFQSSLGVSKTLVIKRDRRKVILPSDIAGNEYKALDDKTLIEKIKNSFDNNSDSPLDKVTYYLGSELMNDIKLKKYQNWDSRGLYIGTESALLWDKIEGHKYYGKEYITPLADFIKNCECDFTEIDNIISLGAGNGMTDKTLITSVKLKSTNNSLCYIPIDINVVMANNAINTVSKMPTRVPFAIIDDFEENPNHVKTIIEQRTHEYGEYNLFSMLGVTFSNLESTEDKVFEKIKSWMRNKDFFLLDALIYEASNKEDFATKLMSKLFPENLDEKPSYKELIVNSILKKFLKSNKFKDLNPSMLENISSSTSKYLNFELCKSGRNYSTIGDTVIIDCKFNFNSKAATLFVGKYYQYSKLKQKLEEYFEVVYEKNGLSEKQPVSRGLFLLKTK